MNSIKPRVASYFWGILLGLSVMGSAMAVEEAKYAVQLVDEPFELRLYESHILAETLVDGEFDEAGSAAFGRLFRYISGRNAADQKVAMTSPVGQTPSGEKIAMTSPVGQKMQDGQWAVSFMMPASFTLETTPRPLDPQIRIREVPARVLAAVRYSGFWSEKGYQKNLAKLNQWIEQQDFTVAGEAIWARYDPPFKPWFLRRNEILIPVEPGASSNR